MTDTFPQNFFGTDRSLHSRLRLVFLCFFAASVSLGVAVISLAKILLLCILPFEIWARRQGRARSDWSPFCLKTAPVMLLALGYLALTIAWAEIPKGEALAEWFRHSRMVFLFVAIYLLRNRTEAVWVLRWFVWVQLFAMLSSWMLWLGLPVPWATFGGAKTSYGVFASYLEQSMMTVIALVMLFHFRDLVFPGRRLRWLGWGLLLLGALNVLLVLPSMTGYVALVVVVLAGLAQQLRGHLKSSPKLLAGVLVGVVLAGVLGFPKVAARVEKIQTEIAQSQAQGFEDSSTGKRLNYWIRSWQSFKQAPVVGHGVGSWNHEYNRMGGGVGDHSKHIRSPHSEFFLWMVEGGSVGLLLLVALLAALELDRRSLFEPTARTAMAGVLLVLLTSSLYNGMLVGIGTGEYFCVALALLLCLGQNTIAAQISPPAADSTTA